MDINNINPEISVLLGVAERMITKIESGKVLKIPDNLSPEEKQKAEMAYEKAKLDHAVIDKVNTLKNTMKEFQDMVKKQGNGGTPNNS